MEIKQVYELVNTIQKEILGEETAILQEDLTGVIDLGEALINANAVDAYAKALVNHIGRVVFVNRVYQGNVPSVYMDAWEFGSVCEKIHADLPEATENESWELENGTSYDPNIFYQPTVEAKFFNKRTTFEIPMSFTEKQLKQSFTDATQLNAFISMLYTQIENSMTVKLDGLIMRTINNFIGETLANDIPDADYGDQTTARCINLLKLYNATIDTPITAKEALTNTDFYKFATYTIGVTLGRMEKMSKVFNIGGKPRFTPKDQMHIVFLEDFAKGADVYLQSDTYHNELTKLPRYETVPFWQGSGDSYEFEDVTGIKVKTSGNNQIDVIGILGVAFDTYALGVTNFDRRVTSQYNAKAEFYNNWYKADAGYFNDQNENFILFYVADGAV